MLVGTIRSSWSLLLHLRRAICAFALGLGLLGLSGLAGAQAERSVVVAPVKGVINPVQAGYVSRVIDQAEQSGASAVVASRTFRRGAQRVMSVPRRGDEEEAPVIAGTFDRLGRGKIDLEIDDLRPVQPDPAAR